MKLIVNTNRIIAALIKDSTSRKILQNEKLEFYTINFGKSEIDKYKDEIIEKSGTTEEEFNSVLTILLQNISIVPDLEIQAKMNEAKEIMDSIDPKDTPFIAAAMAVQCDIWSDDRHFEKQDKVKCWKTKDLLAYAI